MRDNRDREYLVDISSAGRERPWNEKKQQAGMIEKAVMDSDLPEELKAKAEKIGRCADFLWFRQSPETGEKELDHVWLCRQKLCPVCQWRLSMKKFIRLKEVMEIMESEKFVFLTLTVRNCYDDELQDTIKDMRKNFTRMYNQRLKLKEYKTKPAQGFSKGYYYTIELTYNEEEDTYHPHMHCLLDVIPSYWGKKYISMEKWRELWKKFMEIDYVPQVDASAMKKSDAGGVMEMSKYLTKASTYVSVDDEEYTARQFEIMDRELDRVRMVASAGTFREKFREIKKKNVIRKRAGIRKKGKVSGDSPVTRYDFNGEKYESANTFK